MQKEITAVNIEIREIGMFYENGEFFLFVRCRKDQESPFVKYIYGAKDPTSDDIIDIIGLIIQDMRDHVD